MIQMCYVGPKEKGLEFLQAIASWDGERCLLNEVNEKSFLNQQDSVAQILRGKGPSSLFPFSTLPSVMAWMLTDPAPPPPSPSSRPPVVPPLLARDVPPGRAHHEDGPRLRRYAHRLQYVPLPLLPCPPAPAPANRALISEFEHAHTTPIHLALVIAWIFELAGGAIGDFEDNCLPKEQREAAWTVAALHQWDMGIDDPRCVSTAEDWMKTTIKPHAVGGPFPTVSRTFLYPYPHKYTYPYSYPNPVSASLGLART